MVTHVYRLIINLGQLKTVWQWCYCLTNSHVSRDRKCFIEHKKQILSQESMLNLMVCLVCNRGHFLMVTHV